MVSVSGSGLVNSGDVTYDFQVRRFINGNNEYPSILRMTNAGRIGIGSLESWELRSTLNVGANMNSISVDNFAGTTLGTVNGLPVVGGACIGFNAARQIPDANYPNGSFFLGPNGTTPATKNGGAVIWADVEGGLSFTTFPSTGGISNYISINGALANRGLKIGPSRGEVQIGRAPSSASPHFGSYKLAVDGKLVAQSVYVTQTNWADFVFAPSYSLMPLPELEHYLQQNRHLPAIPSAKEVEEQGVNLGTMDAKLLQSIEELTLYIIELNKQNQQLQTNVRTLADKLSQLEHSQASSK